MPSRVPMTVRVIAIESCSATHLLSLSRKRSHQCTAASSVKCTKRSGAFMKQPPWDMLSEKAKNVYVTLGTRCQETINKLKTSDLIDTVRESKICFLHLNCTIEINVSMLCIIQ
jgi:hypothetical protein